jgi:hypothetical protein
MVSEKPELPDVKIAADALEFLLVNYEDWPRARYPVDRPSIELYIDNGVIKTFSWLAFLSGLDGLHMRGFRHCEVCNRRFYAAREDSQACSPRHASTLRQRIKRDADKRKREAENQTLKKGSIK